MHAEHSARYECKRIYQDLGTPQLYISCEQEQVSVLFIFKDPIAPLECHFPGQGGLLNETKVSTSLSYTKFALLSERRSSNSSDPNPNLNEMKVFHFTVVYRVCSLEREEVLKFL